MGVLPVVLGLSEVSPAWEAPFHVEHRLCPGVKPFAQVLWPLPVTSGLGQVMHASFILSVSLLEPELKSFSTFPTEHVWHPELCPYRR